MTTSSLWGSGFLIVALPQLVLGAHFCNQYAGVEYGCVIPFAFSVASRSSHLLNVSFTNYKLLVRPCYWCHNAVVLTNNGYCIGATISSSNCLGGCVCEPHTAREESACRYHVTLCDWSISMCQLVLVYRQRLKSCTAIYTELYLSPILNSYFVSLGDRSVFFLIWPPLFFTNPKFQQNVLCATWFIYSLSALVQSIISTVNYVCYRNQALCRCVEMKR